MIVVVGEITVICAGVGMYHNFPFRRKLLVALRMRFAKFLSNLPNLARTLTFWAKENEYVIEFSYLEELGACRQIELVHDASIYLAVEGSEVALSAFLPEQAAIIVARSFPEENSKPQFSSLTGVYDFAAARNLYAYSLNNISCSDFGEFSDCSSRISERIGMLEVSESDVLTVLNTAAGVVKIRPQNEDEYVQHRREL